MLTSAAPRLSPVAVAVTAPAPQMETATVWLDELWAVWLWHSPSPAADVVIAALVDVFHYSHHEAAQLVRHAARDGNVVVHVCDRPTAEQSVDALQTRTVTASAGPL